MSGVKPADDDGVTDLVWRNIAEAVWFFMWLIVIIGMLEVVIRLMIFRSPRWQAAKVELDRRKRLRRLRKERRRRRRDE